MIKSREIKFRAWFKNNDVPGSNEHMITPGPNPLAIGKLWSDARACTGTAFIMEFTGVQDKNGRDVYEGDIVRMPNGGAGGFITTVEFKDGAFTLFRGKHGNVMGPLEVIGNIHENPELLGDEEHGTAR